MGFKELPNCAVPDCKEDARVAWPGLGWICGKCCIKVNEERKKIEAEKHAADYARLVGAAQNG